ncbi:type IV toxin-antitoxin system AbiEi family antitoxin domain-containing protein [Nocardia vulneris]|uniref:type IV toxin-antitoxin system AbiEi family antitoxin domain-containing protein n=1 Tax=Nocardia vulneris TaxID=1141657 RepID=UPI0007C75624|nr:type IV toxin-antitoxin system AbiEi family antitoxin domain-containing protein [Nocardia vulneris]
MTDQRLVALADLAEEQWGLLTTGQATTINVSPLMLKRYADRNLLVRLRHGVYRLSGAPETPFESLRAEWLALEPKRTAADRLHDPVPVGVVSHRSAAVLQDLGDVDADIHQFTVPKRRTTRSPDIAFHVAALTPDDWHRIDGLPVTRPLRTVIDLAATHIDGGHLARVVRDAILTGDTNTTQVAAKLRPYAHHYGLPAGDGTSLVRDFIRQAGIPASAIDMAAIAATLPALELGQVDFRTTTGKLDLDTMVPVVLREAALSVLTSTPEWAELLADVRNIVAENLGLPPKLIEKPGHQRVDLDESVDDATSTAIDEE